MFIFQPSSLRISKYVFNNLNNFVSSFLYYIPTTSSQRRQGGWLWLLSHCWWYLAHNSQETILMVGITGFVVKIVKQELEVDDTLLQCFDAFAFSIFMKLSNSSSSEDLTPPSFCWQKYWKALFNFLSLCR
jgi:hypothetical protein